jgi:hypothetical protein
VDKQCLGEIQNDLREENVQRREINSTDKTIENHLIIANNKCKSK